MSRFACGRVVGGFIGSEPRKAAEPAPFPAVRGSRVLWMARARHGLTLLARRLPSARIWLPAYCCPALPEAVPQHRIEWFAVDHELRPDSAAIGGARPGDVVVLIAYFGRPVDSADIAAARRSGAFVLIDACQALLTPGVAEGADWVLYSPRKFIRVSDGGLLVGAEDAPWPFAGLTLPAAPADWLATAREAIAERGVFDEAGGRSTDRSWYQAFRLAEDWQLGPCRAAADTVDYLLAGPAYRRIAEIRRGNAQVLIGELGPLLGGAGLPPQAVPLGLPLFLWSRQARDEVRARLHDRGIYTAWHWDLAATPRRYAEALDLASREMTLPLDQRYGSAEMVAIAAEVKAACEALPDGARIRRDTWEDR